MEQVLNPNAKTKHAVSSKDDMVSVFTWNFKSYLTEMLVNPMLFGDVDKLVVNRDGNKWLRYDPDPNDGGEILGSQWMQRTYDWFESNVDGFQWNTHQIHPIIIYGDKIGTNSRQRYSSKPWMFCHTGL